MKEAVAWVFGAGMFLNAGFFVPQALHLWRTRRVQGVSLLTFAGFNVLQITGALQGYFQHDLALMMGMCASLITCGAVTCLAARYRLAARKNGGHAVSP